MKARENLLFSAPSLSRIAYYFMPDQPNRFEREMVKMKNVKMSYKAAIFFFCLSAIVYPQQSASEEATRKAGDLRFVPFKLQAGDESVDGELGRLVVKEKRDDPKSNLIEIAFVRLKSTAERPGPPVIYLDGGPGSSAINLARAPDYFRTFMKLREVGDVILLDQRGVGRSQPNLTRISAEPLPLDFFLDRQKAEQVFTERVGEAFNFFRAKGIDLLAYNTRESAADVDDLRKALGADRVNLVGFSYGTHLGLACIRYHGERLNRVALIGTEGPNHTHKLPSTSDAMLRQLAKLVADDATVGPKVPDMTGLLKRIFDRLDKEPISVRITDPRTRQPVDLKVGKFGLQFIIRMDLGDTNDLPVFPALFYTIDRGDYSIFARFLEKRYAQFGGGVPIMSMVMDAASGATGDRYARINREAKTALLEDVMNFPYPHIGKAVLNPDLGDEFRSELKTSVPTLFISGPLDNNTPPFQADEVRRSFKQSTHLIIDNAGHESMLIEPRVQQVIVDYLKGRDVSAVKIALPPLKFFPIPESKASSN
jgi:pimeloyl-ACP methyl ester carboxylesterase